MSRISKLSKHLKVDWRVFSVVALVVLVFSAYLRLSAEATQASNQRKSPAALAFEAAPKKWLTHPVEVSEFRKALDAGTVKAVGQAANPPNLLLYTLKNGSQFSVKVPHCDTFVCGETVLDTLEDKSLTQGFSFVRVDVDPRSTPEQLLGLFGLFGGVLGALLPMLIAVYVIFKMQMGSLGKDSAKLADRPTLRFKDVIGSKEAKDQLTRVTKFLVSPKSYAKIGAKPPRGVLLVGPPGTGKTLLAKALAGESNANFIAVDGSYFSTMFYGAGILKVKKLFDLARKQAPVILFIDEIDGIGRRNSSPNMSGGESESNRIINRILVELDGFSENDGVVVVAATNHESNLDEALRRPGRFDSLVRMSLPTLPDRKDLFELYLDKVARDPAVDTLMLGRMTAGTTPADIANLVNKASSRAAEENAPSVTTHHVVSAIETFRMGGEVSPIKDLLSEATRERLAYHEAGHALVAHLLDMGVVEHLTIEPRGSALGVTYVSRASEDPLYEESELESRLAMVLAGRAAELLMLDSVSSGAAQDLKVATELAYNMVGNLGFSAEFGVLSVAGIPRELLGQDAQGSLLRGVRGVLERAQDTCDALLQAHEERLETITQALLDKEVISGTELQDLLGPKLVP